MNNKKHTLVLVVGKTGSGKSCLINKLCERTKLKPLLSYTTRPCRGDKDNDHIFVTEEEYWRAKANNEIIIETEISGNYYYATRDQLYTSDLYTINPSALDELLSMNLPDIRFVIVYISCPDKIREERAVNKRGDNKQTYRTRSFSERIQFRKFIAEEQWDYSIKNINLSKAYSVLRWICDIEGVWKNHNQNDIGKEEYNE